MNVFEDLIGELKEENLLEETVIAVANSGMPDTDSLPEPAEPAVLRRENSAGHLDGAEAEIHETESPVDDREFYRKRAMEEVSSLQMVEHVMSGVEREHMKMSPAVFDDLGVKKALHRFIQVPSDKDNEDLSQAEYSLMQETEAWFSALSARDANISVANIRRFCENSRPVLSSQALIALARFYRNSPFSEPIRGKFDFVMTRLFSRELGEEQRKQLFPRGEMVGHIKTLYSNWSSLDLFGEGEHAEKIAEAVRGFDTFVSEAADAQVFDDLISSDLFNRIRLFKEQTAELFFSIEVTAAAIECNVKIGNRFVELLRKAGEAASLDSIESRYGYTHDTVISSAASKTLHLLEILKEERVGRLERVEPEDASEDSASPNAVAAFERAPVEENSRFRLLAINRWLVIATILVLILSGGVYFWSENVSSSQGEIAQAATVEMSDPDLRQHLRLARTSSETFYGVAQPSWSAKSEEEQKQLLQKALKLAESLKMKRVNILNNKGRTIGFATAEKIEVYGP